MIDMDWTSLQYWASLTSIPAFLITIFVSYRGWLLTRWALRYSIERQTLFTLSNRDEKNDLEIRYRGVVINEVEICTIRIENQGRHIDAGDFDRGQPIAFRVRAGGRLLQKPIQVGGTYDLTASIRTKMRIEEGEPIGTGFDIEPLLINRGEWFAIKVVGENLGELSPLARIRGGEIKKISDSSRRTRINSVFFTTLMLLIGAVMIIDTSLAIWNPTLAVGQHPLFGNPELVLALELMLIGLCLLILVVMIIINAGALKRHLLRQN